jgi:hypothetical protein
MFATVRCGFNFQSPDSCQYDNSDYLTSWPCQNSRGKIQFPRECYYRRVWTQQ